MSTTTNSRPQLFFLVKFGKEKYNEKFIKNGVLRFSSPENYNQDNNEESGDKYEGSKAVINGTIDKISINHPTLGFHEFKSFKNAKSQITLFNDSFLILSLYSISTRNINNKNEIQIDEKMLNFDDCNSAVWIIKPYKFLEKLASKLQSLDIKYKMGFVDYKNLRKEESKITTGPFIKKIEHSHQREYRIIIENKGHEFKFIQLGNISEYCHLVSAQSMIDMKINNIQKLI